MLGAGLDTRSYRLPAGTPIRCFEVAMPWTQPFKRAMLKKAGIDTRGVTYVGGRIVHRWRLPGYRVFQARLLPTVNLLLLSPDPTRPPPPQIPFDQPPPPFAQHIRRLGGGATDLREIDWDGGLVWEYHNE